MEQFVDFNFRANYFSSGPITKETKEVWFVLHGYGQLAKYFINKFNDISSSERVIIAPGGLSRFYLRGFNGRVGSTWMTKEDRLLDIDNYVNYLQAVYAHVSNDFPQSHNIKITFLGFSQGGATVTRWIQRFEDDFERLILWAGSFPHDMDIAKVGDKLKGKKVQMIRGTEDQFVNDKAKEEQQRFIDALSIEVEHITFKGEHDIDNDTLIKVANQAV